jgi:hypothetical protein
MRYGLSWEFLVIIEVTHITNDLSETEGHYIVICSFIADFIPHFYIYHNTVDP